MRQLVFFLISLFILSACSNKTNSDENLQHPKVKVAKKESLKKIETEIEGMTCEIGCARLIESKLSKVTGIKSVKVDFESKKGFFEYDESILSKEDISLKMAEIAGGDLYRVTKITAIN